MNIKDLKTLVANLPDEITAEQFDLIAADMATLEESKRQADESELQQALAKVAELQVRLGKPVQEKTGLSLPPVVMAAGRRGGDFTDADLGIGDDDDNAGGDGDMTMSAFTSELRSARASGAAKRRNLS